MNDKKFLLRKIIHECGDHLDRVKRIWDLSSMRAAKVQARLRIEPPLLAHISSESRGTFRQKARALAPLNGWACADKICHDGMLEDTNSLDGAHLIVSLKWTKTIKKRERILQIPFVQIKGSILCPVHAYKVMCKAVPAT